MESNTLMEREAPEMKFILGGRSFDTAGATTVAVHRGHQAAQFMANDGELIQPESRFEHVVYRTARGSFFLHEHSTTKLSRGRPVVVNQARELNAQEVVAWIAEHGAAIVDASGLNLPEEA